MPTPPLRTLGLLGGMSWESTREYYRILNESVRDARGGLRSAPVILHSFDFEEIQSRQRSNSWNELDTILSNAAKGLENAGCNAIMICTNLMHKCAPAIEKAVSIPLIHIADAIAENIKADNLKTVGLLGARGTMQEPFYRERLATHGITAIIPNDADCEIIHRVIFDELCQGKFLESSRTEFLRIISELESRGAQGMVLGCTEIELLITSQHTPLPLYNSAQLHAEAGARFVLGVSAIKVAA